MSTALIGQLLSLLANLVSRFVFAKYLSREYLGLAGLFTNILTMLSLVELGVGPAITFSLYKPIATGDKEQIKSLMRMYRKAYWIIGTLVIVLGLCFTPFYPFFIKDTQGVENLTLIYWLYVLNTGLSYFYSYKISLITADQNQYIRNIVHYVMFVLMNIAQTVILIVTKNYIPFLVCQVVFTFAGNYVLSRMADRMYPYLKDKDVKPLSKEVTGPIWRNIRAMMCHKVGDLVVNSTDNLLISKFLGLGISGIFSNYSLIITAIKNILAKVFDSVIASVGNLNANEDTQKLKLVYYRIYYLSFWLYAFCGISLGCIVQPFIRLVFGDSYLLDNYTVIALVVCLYTTGLRKASNVLRSAAGLYYKDWYKPIIESIVNLVASIILLKSHGVLGVFLGTVISTVLVSTWIEAMIVYRDILNDSITRFFARYGIYTALFVLGYLVTSKVCDLVTLTGVLGIVIRIAICLVLPNLLFTLLTFKSSEFVYFRDLARKILRQIGKKVKPTAN